MKLTLSQTDMQWSGKPAPRGFWTEHYVPGDNTAANQPCPWPGLLGVWGGNSKTTFCGLQDWEMSEPTTVSVGSQEEPRSAGLEQQDSVSAHILV